MKAMDHDLDEGLPEDPQSDAAIAELPAPALDERFSARVLAMAKRELATAEPQRAATRLRLAVQGALVPALLTSAAGCRTVLTAETVERAFGAAPVGDAPPQTTPASDDPTRGT
jgi:hypothetical protein